jgi:DNA polymerase-1
MELVGHNIFGFDLEVAMHWFKLPPRDPLITHDTMFEAYLIDPNTPSLHLKDLASGWLGMPPDDQQELYDWIMANVPECRTRKQCGAYICRAPGDLVGKYAESDTEMAFRLHEYCYPKLDEMHAPYDRERTLAPILASIKKRGIKINVEQLRHDYKIAMEKLHTLDQLIRERLHSPNMNPGSDRELVTALQSAGYKGFLTTPTGKLSANKASLEKVLSSDKELQTMLKSRATYSTLTGTFMGPWLELAEANGGTINPQYNQVRNAEGYGTRTGRLSSSAPNGQNIPDEQGLDYFGDHFPNMRSYCLPDDGCVWYSFDFKAQEPRVTAHFEDGIFLQAFNDDPEMDPYIFVMELVGGDVTRKDCKVILLGLIYAMGAQVLADKLECSYERASSLRNAIKAHMPDIVRLDRDCKRRFELGLPVKTLGGRFCHCEPPSNGRVWAYKALNLLVQGSSADQTKEAIIYSEEALETEIPGEFRLLGTVHDEINLCAPLEYKDMIFKIMTEAANALPCDAPMRLTMGIGKTWAEAAK